jgi:endonuclease/exonuclease/phosphatase (EEP) superfamily protein YafD
MKILKFILGFVTFLLAFIAIAVSLGSVLCKFTDLSKNTIILSCGYISFFWVILLSSFVLLLFLVLRKFRVALSFFVLMVLFSLFLDDFSLKFIRHRSPEKYTIYDSLSVGAYNVMHYAYGIDKISKFIKESDFDLMLLSESVLTPEKIVYLRNTLPSYTILTDNGHDLSILSKYPVLNYKIVELPTYLASLSGSNDIEKLSATGIHRSMVHAVINVKGTFVNVISLRLIAGRPKDKSISEGIRWGKYLINAHDEELSVFLGYLHTLKGPVIFGGDLNVQPNTAIIHRIKNYAEDTYLDNHMHGTYTFKVSFPTLRIDYLFHSKDIVSKNSEVIKVRDRLSDHYPVKAEFLIPRKSVQAIN